MNQSTFQLLGNVASADFYLCEGSDITLISDNNAYNMKALAQEALKLRVPNSLTVIDLNNFYVGMMVLYPVKVTLKKIKNSRYVNSSATPWSQTVS
ncbi:MAG: hypothetical protein E7I21_11090 [Limosilactobacillus fermentum]|nr:hypothetical protein [Limosilactobacillus fermentum]